ncbi:alpha/beta hydrolase [Massilia sp. W12]|uniref:lipase family alpha/beta hydrolase n=1 Tax=Massilia sp. W12 TaxID=3126507 RepID=UPI0030D57330
MTKRKLTLQHALKEAVVGPTPDLLAFSTSWLSLRDAPRGDGRPVLVLPGFLSGDMPTWPLRQFLSGLGYHCWPWGLGLNLGVSSAYEYDIEALIEHRLKEIWMEASDQKISVIGWSLGGVYARELARKYPHLIRDVITLGSPINGNPAESSITRLYSWVTRMQVHDADYQEKIRQATQPVPDVPVTAFYSPDDNIVPPQCARETPGPLTQNIEVDCTHTGFGFSALVFYLVAHRLAATPGEPIDAESLKRRFRDQRLPFSLGRWLPFSQVQS